MNVECFVTTVEVKVYALESICCVVNSTLKIIYCWWHLWSGTHSCIPDCLNYVDINYKWLIVGDVELRRGLDTTYATIASRCVLSDNCTEPDKTANLFTLLKLMPLSEKLRLFSTIEPEETVHAQVTFALLSDIADKQNVFITYVKSFTLLGAERKANVLKWQTALTAVANYDFSEMVNRVGGTGVTALTRFLLHLCVMVSCAVLSGVLLLYVINLRWMGVKLQVRKFEPLFWFVCLFCKV